MRIIRTKNSLLGVAFLVLISIQFSCKSVYELGQKRAYGMSDNKLYKRVVDSSLQYKTLFIKRFSARYKSNKESRTVRGSIKIMKDSMIMIQLNAPAGVFEAVRMLITPDSVKILDRLKKNYIASDFKFLARKLNMDIDFTKFQSILTNEIFQFQPREGRHRPFVRNFKGKVIDDKYVFISDKAAKVERKLRKEKHSKLFKFNYQRFEIDPSLMKITDAVVRLFGEEKDISLKYRDFVDIEGQKFPSELDFKIQSATEFVSCKVKYNKLVLNPKLRFPFKVTSKYERIYPD